MIRMNVNSLKEQLHQLIERTDDEKLLSEIYNKINAEAENTDWWGALTGAQKNRVLESEQQYQKGDVVTNEEVLQKIQQWLQR